MLNHLGGVESAPDSSNVSSLFTFTRYLPVQGEGTLKRFFDDHRGATAIEYGLIVALIALAVAGALPLVEHEITATMVRSREGLKGKVCQGDPTASGIQCN